MQLRSLILVSLEYRIGATCHCLFQWGELTRVYYEEVLALLVVYVSNAREEKTGDRVLVYDDTKNRCDFG